MISKDFSDDLSASLLQMQHFIHQQLSQHRQRQSTHISIVLAKSLLAPYTAEQCDQHIAALELFLQGLEATTSEWKIDHKQTQHTISIVFDAQQNSPSFFKKIWQKINHAIENDLKGNYNTQDNNSIEQKPPVVPSFTPPPLHNNPTPAPQANVNVAKGRLTRIDNALSVLANELRYFINLSNQREDGKRVFAITRVEFKPKNQQADSDLNYYLSIHKTSAHWAARLKAQFNLPEDKKDISPFLNLSAVNFVNLGFGDQQEEYRHAQQVSNLDYDISFESDEREYTLPDNVVTMPIPSTNTNTLTIDILDARFSQTQKPTQTQMSVNQFYIGREADITIMVGQRHFCSSKHLNFEYKNEQWYVTDMSSNGSLHNGQVMPKDQEIALKSGDAFRLGAKPSENTNDHYDQFPEVKISFELARKTTANKRTPLRTPLNQTPIVRTELAQGQQNKALCYIGLWIGEQWHYQAIYQLPALIGREGGSSTQARTINIPSQFSKVSGEHLQLLKITSQQLEIEVCQHCTNGVFNSQTANKPLAKHQTHLIAFGEELFLASQNDAKGIKICFKQGDDASTATE